MKKTKTKRNLKIEKIKSEFVKYCDEKEAEETRSADSFDEINMHFTTAVARLGKHLAGTKPMFVIRVGIRRESGEMLTVKVKGKATTWCKQYPVKYFLQSKDPANCIVYLLWDCLGGARGLVKDPVW